MKKINIIILMVLLFFLSGVKAQNAKEIFLENLTVFEKVAKDENESISLNTLYEVRSFLIEITGIKYEMEKAFDMPIFPPKETLKEWRDWFEKNKEKLYWDEKAKKVNIHS